MRISVDTNATEVARSLRFLFREQIPFATSVAINNTAKEIQKEQREGMKSRFTIRRPWVLQGVRISKFSNKRDLEAIVEIDPSRAFLFKFEEGGTTRPRGTRFAVPDEVRRGKKTDIVARSMRPRALKFKFHGTGPRAEVHRGDKRTFMIRRPDGTGVVLQRLGRRGLKRMPKGQRRAGKVRRLFTFEPVIEVEPTLEFELTAQTVFQHTFARNFEFAFNRAVRSAR